MPLGLIKQLLKLANNGARDIENQSRFRNSIIDSGSTFSLDTTVGKCTRILEGCVINWSQIGSYSYVNKNTLIQNAKIGNYCSIASNVKIGLGRHPINLFSTSTLFYTTKNTFNIKLIENDLDFQEYLPIIIEHDVWIGTGAIVMDGVRIGNGAIIAAGAVVTKDVAPFAIVGGIPAKIIKYRFSENIREQLLEKEWWLKEPHEVIEQYNELIDLCKE